jgi:hypothetical protein
VSAAAASAHLARQAVQGRLQRTSGELALGVDLFATFPPTGVLRLLENLGRCLFDLLRVDISVGLAV